MQHLKDIILNESNSQELRFESVLHLHMNTLNDRFSNQLWDIEFNEGGKVNFDVKDNFCFNIEVSGDNGRFDLKLSELLTLTEKTRNSLL